MTEEEIQEYAKNCYDGLNSLNTLIDSLLADEAFSNDDGLMNTKKDAEQSLSSLSGILDSSNDKVKKK